MSGRRKKTRNRRFPRRGAPHAAGAALLALLLAGCSGGGKVDLIELQLRDLSEDETLISTVDPGACFFSVDEDGFLNVALRYRNVALLGPLSKITMDLSFELDEPPAGSARQYILRSRNLRGRIETGAITRRLKSTNGVLSVWMRGDDQIHCRFRVTATQQVFTMLTGWQRGTPLLLLGDFVAVRNADQYDAINTDATADDWTRPARRTVPLYLDHTRNAPAASQPADDKDSNGD